jgi:hypothetical protein
LNHKAVILIFGVLLLSSCDRSTTLQVKGETNNSTSTDAIAPMPKLSVATPSPITPQTNIPKPHKQDRLNKQALAAVDRQAYDTAIDLFEKALANSDNECHRKYNQAWIKAAKKAKSWNATTLSSFALHHMITTDQKLAKDQKEVFDESFENNLKGYKCDF